MPRFLAREGLTSAALEAESGTARQTVAKIRGGKDVRLSTMLRNTRGARRATGRPVQMGELWELDPDEYEPD